VKLGGSTSLERKPPSHGTALADGVRSLLRRGRGSSRSRSFLAALVTSSWQQFCSATVEALNDGTMQLQYSEKVLTTYGDCADIMQNVICKMMCIHDFLDIISIYVMCP